MENEEQSSGKILKSSHVKCENCGNNLVFNPATQSLRCRYCESEFSFAQDAAVSERDLDDGLRQEERWSDAVCSLTCDNCGANVLLDTAEASAACPFCGTPHVVSREEYRGLKPNAVVPFLKTPEEVGVSLAKWAKNKLFAPRAFSKSVKKGDLKGVYMPCFTFDSNTSSEYRGRIGIEHRHTYRDKNGQQRTEVTIEWRIISGTYNEFFDDILITAGSRLSQKQLDKIGNYSSESNRAYDDRYLYGFSAYVKEKDAGTCWKKAKERIEKSIRRSILAQYTYDRLDYLNVATNHNDTKYKYVLYPVYLGCYKKGKKNYTYMANGVTGKAYGKTPVSPLRVLVAALIGIAIVSAFLILGYYSR